MKDVFVVVDGAHARWFELQRRRLVETRTLVNPEHQLPERAVYSESKSGRRDGVVGPAQSFDDHRTAHDRETDRRFARLIAEGTIAQAPGEGDRVVLASTEEMLGLLRPELGGLTAHGAELVTVDKNWARWKAHEIQDALAELGLVEARPRLMREAR